MKKIFLLFALIFTFKSYAQDTATFVSSPTADMTEAQYIDTAFGSLDTNRISFKYLIDRVPVNFGPGHYTGLTGGIDTVKTKFAFDQIYASLYLSQVSGHPHFTDPLVFANTADSEYGVSNDTVVPIMMFMGEYNSIDTNSYADGLMLTFLHSVKLQDAELLTIPYDTFGVFAAMASQQKIVASTGHFYFQFSPDFFASNIPADVGGTVEVDFGDGAGFHSFSMPFSGSITLQANYVTQGNETVTVKYTPPSGPQRISRFVIFVVPLALNNYSPTEIWNITGTHGFDSHAPGTGKAYCYMGCDQVLDKPVIVVEGFDVDNSIKYSDVYDSLNSQVVIGGNSEYLADNLRDLGYDVIILMFNYNQDYIESNAYVLEGLINYVNANKVGNDKITVIGLSMGGLIARYCLKNMEDSSHAHNVGLYVSYDAPQQGANIPLGLQFLFNDMHNDIGGLQENAGFLTIYKSFNSPAAGEMLIYKAGAGSGGTLVSSQRISFASALQTKGYPSACKMIAVTNGSQTDIAQSFAPGGHIFDWKLRAFVDNITADAWALPNYSTSESQISGWFYEVTVPQPILHPFLTVGLDDDPVSVRKAFPFDNQPGGQENTQDQFVSQVTSGINFSGNTATDYGFPNHCFIPSVGALDLNDQNYGLAGAEWFPHSTGDNIVSLDVVSSHMTPFSAVVNPEATSVNEDHITMHDSIYTFLYNNITGSSSGLLLNRDLGVGGFEYFNYAPGTPSDLETQAYNGIVNDGTLDIGDTSGDGAVMQVNGNAKAGFSTSSGAIPTSGSSYTVTFGGCDPFSLKVHNQGKLVIGDSSGNKGIVYVLDGSSIYLEAGATLEIYNNSSLIFEQGANLICDGNATIKLFGSNSILNFNGGALSLANGVTFSLSPPSQLTNSHSELYGEGMGFIDFVQAAGYEGDVNISTTGSHAFFVIGGTDYSHKVMQVEENSYVYPLGVSFKIDGGLVLMDDGARINTYDSLTLSNSEINELRSGYPHDGIHTYGQEGIQISCAVHNATTGFTDYSVGTPGFTAKLIACGFYDCGTGIYCYNVPIFAGLQVKNSTNDGIDLLASAGLDSSYIANSFINSNGGNGIYSVYGSTASELDLSANQIDSNGSNGVYAASANLYLKCNTIGDNSGYGVLSDDPGSNLYMAPFYASDGKTGYNDMYDNTSSNIDFVLNSTFNLNDGDNAFYYSYGYNINGDIYSCTDPVYADSNYWNKGGTVESSLTSGVDYGLDEDCWYSITISPITLTDSHPLSSWSQPDICTGEGGGSPDIVRGGRMSLLSGSSDSSSSGTQSPVTVNRYAATLNSASDKALASVVGNVMDSLNANNLPTSAYNGLTAMLNAETKRAIAKDKPLVDLAYIKMMQCVTKIIKADKKKLDSTQKAALIATAYTVQVHMLKESSDYKDSFQYARDEAILHRDAGDRNTALAHLDMLRTFAHEDSYNYIDQWKCWIQTEIGIANKTIDLNTFNPLTMCNYSSTPISPMVVSQKQNLRGDETVTQNEMSISPNPVCEICNVDYSLGAVYNVRVQVVSMTGQVLLSQNLGHQVAGSYTINMPVSQLKEGLYIVKLLTDGTVMEDKFVKSR